VMLFHHRAVSVLTAGCASQALRFRCPKVRLIALATRNRTCTGDALNVVSLGGRLPRLGLRELLAQGHQQIGSSSRCCSGRIALQKRSAGCCMKANMACRAEARQREGWSQSRVLPSASWLMKPA